MVRIRSEIEKNTLFGRALVRIMAKTEKTPFLSWVLVRIRSKIKTNTLIGRALVKVRAKID